MNREREENLRKWRRKRVYYWTTEAGKSEDVKLRQDLHLSICLFLANKFYCVINCLKADSRVGWPNIFLNVLELFSLLKRKLSNFRFRSIFIFNKKEPQSCQFATYWRNPLLEFLTSQNRTNDFYSFIIRWFCISLTH